MTILLDFDFVIVEQPNTISQRIPGHNKIETTILYMQLAKNNLQNLDDKYTIKIARNKEEIKALLEVGFEYICEKDELYYFRKRKIISYNE